MSIFATPYETPSRENPADDIDEILKIVEENERLKNPEVLWPERIEEMDYLADLKLGRSASEWRKIFEADFPVGGILPYDAASTKLPAFEFDREAVVPKHTFDAMRYSMPKILRPRTVVSVHNI